jgi:TonB family protein
MTRRTEQGKVKTSWWNNPSIRNSLLFSLSIHLCVTLIIFIPSSFFHRSTPPEIYSVELIQLDEAMLEPEPVQPDSTPKPPRPKVVDEPAVSTKPVLSTRNIPQTPTEIKILRPRKIKKDLRKDQSPIDQTMVFAALERLKIQEQQVKAEKELERAKEAEKNANDEALQALRQSILTRQPLRNTDSVQSPSEGNNNNTSGQQNGQRANTIRNQYNASVIHHVGSYWRLPEGQKWDKDLTTTVVVKIKENGVVTSSKIYTSSKSKQFDKIAIETIEKASPLPPLPAELSNIPLKLHFYPKGL